MALRSSLNQGQTNFEHTFAAKVDFYEKIEAKGGGDFKQDVNIDKELSTGGDAFFGGNVTIEKDLIVKGNFDVVNLLVRDSFDVGIGGTVLTADTTSENVGIGTTIPVEKFQVSSGDDTFIVDNEGRVGIGTTIVGGSVASLDDDTQGKLRLDIDGSISINRNIYDSAGSPGFNNYWLRRDEEGIKWVALTPAFEEGISIQDEGVFLPTDENGNSVGAAQSFSTLNFVQRNSLGLGTDTLRPTAADQNSPGTGLATIFTNDLWGFVGIGTSAPIYRDTRVGIKQSNPLFDLDVNGTLNVEDLVTFKDDTEAVSTTNAAVEISGGVGIAKKLFIGGDTKIESFTDATASINGAGALKVNGGAAIGQRLFVGGNTRLESDTDATASNLVAALHVDGGTAIGKKLFIGGNTKVESTTGATASNAVAALQVVGGTAIGEKLFVGSDTKVESNTGATASDATAALQVVGGTAIGEKLFVGNDTKVESNTGATASDAVAALQVVGGVAIGEKLFVGNNTKIEGTIELDNSLIDINEQTGVNGKDYRLASVGAGVSWRPSGVETKQTIWVSKSGNDANGGLLEGDAKATVGAAAAIAQPGDTIKIRPGVYVENNPIGLQRDVSITGEDLRLVTIEPQNVEEDVFWVRRGCLIENLNFAGENVGVAHTGAGAVAFPITGQTANSGYTPGGPADEGPTERWRSPYVRNCTNFMTKSIGMRINGDDATSLSDPGADLKSMVCDSFTQYNEAGIGVSLTNNAYAQLVSIFTINNDIAIYADTGAQCDLTNSNSSFGNFGLVAVGLGSTQYTGKVNADIIPGDNSDVVVGKGVTDLSNAPRRPFDGQALYFKIDLGNYPDAIGNGRIDAPLQELSSIEVIGSPGGYSITNPPSVIIRDADGTLDPKGPQGIIAEASATINEDGILTAIDVINSGRNYLSTQNIVVEVNGDTTLATAVMEPIYFTIFEATEPTTNTGITTMTFNEFVPYELFEDDPFTLQRISRILTSSHSFEYVGSGTSINTSLPFEGAIPIKENEVVASKGAQIPFTSTDQKGNFDIGEGIQVDQTTSTIRGRDFSKAIQAEVTPLILALR